MYSVRMHACAHGRRRAVRGLTPRVVRWGTASVAAGSSHMCTPFGTRGRSVGDRRERSIQILKRALRVPALYFAHS